MPHTTETPRARTSAKPSWLASLRLRGSRAAMLITAAAPSCGVGAAVPQDFALVNVRSGAREHPSDGGERICWERRRAGIALAAELGVGAGAGGAWLTACTGRASRRVVSEWDEGAKGQVTALSGR